MRILPWCVLGVVLFSPGWTYAGSAATPHVGANISPESRSGWIGALRGNRNYTSTISGTSVRPSNPQLLGLSYDGACENMASGNYTPVVVPFPDYESSKTGGYSVDNCDTSANDCQDYGSTNPLIPALWRTLGAGEPSSPAPLAGTRSLWCGNPQWTTQNTVVPGYPNSDVSQPHMLYVDTGDHGAATTYGLTFQMNFSCSPDDPIYLIGGGGNAQDPIGVDWVKVENIIKIGPQAGSQLLVVWRGSFRTDQMVDFNTSTPPQSRDGGTAANSPPPETKLMTIQHIPAAHRALYFIFIANDQVSTEDGLWPSTTGHGQLIDNLLLSDSGTYKFLDGAPPPLSCSDPLGVALSCTGTTLDVSSRTPGDVAAMGISSRKLSAVLSFNLQPGSGLVNDDFCSPGKSSPVDLIWTVANPTVPAGATAGLEQCVFPVPVGTTSLVVSWRHYLDIPEGDGYVQVTEYRFYKGGAWSTWRNSNPSGAVRSGSDRAWVTESDEITDAAQADSIQMRFWLKCIPALSAGQQSCPPIAVGIYYDSFGLWAFTGGVPAPTFGMFPGTLAQTTFVDGTMTGLNCSTPPCWPGVRGTALTPSAGGIDDNVNGPVGDSLVVFLRSPFRRNGMGLNWRFGYDKSSPSAGIVHTNASYNATFGEPRMIYRLFDPATKTWSQFDSTALDANDVRVSATDTALVDNAFRTDWPPRDKAGLNLPGGFTVNGIAAYSSLSFLPRGARLQYYVKAVDLVGNVAYQFQADAAAYEVQDIPTLPGGSAKAPDIMEFDVLPRVYSPGSPGSLLAGKTNTPVLNLDGAYTAWSFSQDPVTQALLGLGVRADRYRLQQAIGYGNNVGGHELTGPPDVQIPNRPTNYFPNMTEYGIRDSLSTWYRILIQSSHLHIGTTDDESDARLINEWWNSSTPGTSGGDRCLFASGDDYFNSLLHAIPDDPSPRRVSLAQNVLGVSIATGSWNGTGTVLYPTVDDRFAAPGAVGQQGVPLAALGYNYPDDGGPLGPNRFDALTKMGSSDAQNAAFYPLFSGVTDVAAVAMHAEKDAVTDKDRNKALGYGYSIQFVRKTGIPTNSPNYVHSGVQERMQILYKFLASCRGARTGAAGDTAKCWPCPTDANMTGNWAGLAGFQTGQNGPLYPIQDPFTATGIEEEPLGVPGIRNQLGQNRPNPFNPSTVIPYGTSTAGLVTIRIYDVGGRLVRTLEQGVRPAGEHVVRWDGRLQRGESAGSGVYFYRIEYPGGGVSSKKMILLR